jgi:rhamnulose-1-phosphate aldolase
MLVKYLISERLDMNGQFESLLIQVGNTANEIWLRGWAEANAGNISIRIDIDNLPEMLAAKGGWQNIGCALPEIAGDFFLVSGTGTFLKNFQAAPADNLGIIEIDSAGGRYRVIWGYLSGGSPTSELPAHLRTQAVKKTADREKYTTVLHVHCPHLTALGLTEKLDTAKLTTLLWQTHIECLIFLPDGVEYIPPMIPGSTELAEATAKAFAKRRVVVWQHHGIVAAGADLDHTVGLIHIIEKTCEIYLLACAAGTIENKISKDMLVEIANRFNLSADKEIMSLLK